MNVSYTSKIFHVNGINLHAIDEGKEGDPLIIFLHGFPEFWYSWRRQIPFFVSHGYRVIVPDQRGYNLTDKPRGVESYRIELLTKDILELIKILGGGKVYLVGHDWGAAVAWRVALHHKDCLFKLVIINLPHPLVMKKNLSSNPLQMIKSWYILFFQIPLIPEKLLAASNFRVIKRMLAKSSNKHTYSDQDLKRYEEAWCRDNALTSMVNWYRAAVRFSHKFGPGKEVVEVPTLILWGAKDLALVKTMAEESIGFCREGVLQLFDDATHWLHQEKPGEVNQKILEFFR